MIIFYSPIEASDDSSDSRIDKYIASLNLPELQSRTFVEQLIKEGSIVVNGRHIRKNYRLKDNDVIEVALPKPKPTSVEPENIPLDIVYEDDYLAVINKPAGMIVHPTSNVFSGTIVNAIMHRFGNQLADADKERPGIVHRLDKNTSGLLLIAKDNETLHRLKKLFQERKIEKYYKAILIGIPNPPSGIINTNIGRSSSDRTMMTVKKVGREAITDYSTEESFTYFSLVDIKLITGRTHQIRVHFNNLNCPVLGDSTYGTRKLKSLIPLQHQKRTTFFIRNRLKRQALHSYKLVFEHPMTGEELSLTAPLPNDMNRCLNWLKDTFPNE